MIFCWSQLKSSRETHELIRLKNEVNEICLLSAEKKDFKDNKERDEFCWRWVTQYLEKFPELTFVFIEEGKVLGYIVACPDTSQFLGNLDQKGLFWWQETYPVGYIEYPCHLHINCHPDSRGKGVGSQLMDSLIKKCVSQGLSGIHLITLQGARNVGFYNKLGFELRATYSLGEDEQTTLVFLGKNLSNS